MNKGPLPIKQLGYVGIETTDLVRWQLFAADFLGMQVVDAGSDTLHLRMDDRPFRLFVKRGERDRLACIGWEVEGASALDQLSEHMASRQCPVQVGVQLDCLNRRVAALNWFKDPDGNRIELFHGPMSEDIPFKPNGAIGGFRTGDLGLGHVVLQTPQIGVMSDFYRELGFRLSDFMESPIDVRFLHTNARHHSLALLQSAEVKFHHLMIEYMYLDDIGRIYDRAQTIPDRIVSTLGRHTNDHMLSFYSQTPGGFMVETGWAGRLIDVESWQQERISSPSLWGHERKWLPEVARNAIRAEMDLLALSGKRAPVEVTNSPGFNLSRIS